jgi:small subunit ribosomal protein S16
LAVEGTEEQRIDIERVDYWISVGAQLSDRAAKVVDAARKGASA